MQVELLRHLYREDLMAEVFDERPEVPSEPETLSTLLKAVGSILDGRPRSESCRLKPLLVVQEMTNGLELEPFGFLESPCQGMPLQGCVCA